MTQKSFLKWVGSKSKILDQLLPHLPAGNRLVEPFVGAGNVFINTDYPRYFLADANRDLINVYDWLKYDVATVINVTENLFNQELDFYTVRASFNAATHRTSPEQAARFIWLNRNGFNGLCRYNKHGLFNVPKGQHQTIHFPRQAMIDFSNALNTRKTAIACLDFNQTLLQTGEGDIIYCDPPYLAEHIDGFVGYTSAGFGYTQTAHLAQLLIDAVERGATAVISNIDSPTTQTLFKQFERHPIDAPRTVASNGNRKSVKELIGVLTRIHP